MRLSRAIIGTVFLLASSVVWAQTAGEPVGADSAVAASSDEAKEASQPASEVKANEPEEPASPEASVEKPSSDAAADSASPAPAAEPSSGEATSGEPEPATPATLTNEDPPSTVDEPTTVESSASGEAVTSSTAVDGEPIDRSSFYFGLGLGLGGASLADDSLAGTPAAGALSFRAGVAIGSRYLIGSQITLVGQFHKWEPETVTGAMLSSFLLEVMVFPMPDLPLNVSVGAGWGSAVKLLRLVDTRKGSTNVASKTGNGGAWMGAVGWDFFPGRGTNFGLQLRYDGTQSADFGVDHMGSLNAWLNFY